MFFRFLLLILVITPTLSHAQQPVPMGIQPALTYEERFDSVGFWANGFVSGPGAAAFAPVSIGGAQLIPHPQRITTSSQAFITGSSGGLHVDSAGGRLMMLVTGTTDHTNAVAFDVLFNFMGVQADSLKVDWATVFNGATSSNRKGTLLIYASTDGVNFTEIPGSAVTITNYLSASGTLSVPLPAAFDNAANARLRFYYYNAPGGTTGSRPLIALDRITVTVIGTPCVLPMSSPGNLQFSNTTATSTDVSFDAATPVPDEYLIILTTNSSLTGQPLDGAVYEAGDEIGDGLVVQRGNATNCQINGLDPSTSYTLFVYSVNIFCNGTIRYRTIDPLSGVFTTPAGPPCQAPGTQPSNLQFNATTTHSISGSYNSVPDAYGYLVVRTTGGIPGMPVNGQTYQPGDALGVGTVVYSGGSTSFVATGLDHSTTYYFYVFAFQNFACSNGPAYQTDSPLNGQQQTGILLPCQPPGSDADQLQLLASETFIEGFLAPAATADGYLVIVSQGNNLSALPQDGNVYQAGGNLGGGTVVSTGRNYSFVAEGLSPNTSYTVFVFGYNANCIGGPLYRTISFLSGSTTTGQPFFKHYFGNLHAHSSHSDGNQDDPTKTPSDNYEFARQSLCMDFLGISEHNHYTANNNPGMLLNLYHQGLAAASNYNQQHPDFLALYGMEWGTLTNGGHALIYGIDSLIGWETVGGNPNYDIYVAKNDFLSPSGLFATLNQYYSKGVFSTLAHPSFSHFGQLAFQPFSKLVDSAVVGVAIESGPAFSTAIDYSDPAVGMSHLDYYETLLSRGYHVAPMIDHDNHNMTFGRTAYTRTAVLAPVLQKDSFLLAMQARRFYATQDCDTRVTLTINGRPMGSEYTAAFEPALTVYASDPTDPGTVPIIRLRSGVPGSNQLPVTIRTDTAYSVSFTDLTVEDSMTVYYYADIQIGANRTITAPVWYTRADSLSLRVDKTPVLAGRSGIMKLLGKSDQNQLRMQLVSPSSVNATIELFSLAGQKIYSAHTTVGAGLKEWEIGLPPLAPGMYLIQGTLGTDQFQWKLYLD